MLDREITDAEVLTHWGAPLRERFAPLASGDPGVIDSLVEAYVAHYEARHDQMASLFPGVYVMLAALKRRGCRMGVVTSKRRRSTLQALDAFHLRPFIGVAVSADDVKSRKPAPEPIREALRQLAGHPRAAWMVGDGVFDMQAARAAGVRSVAALWGTREVEALLAAAPDRIAASPPDVVAVVTGGEGRP